MSWSKADARRVARFTKEGTWDACIPGLYDVMGRRLMSAEVTGSEYRIPGSDLHTGVYVLRMNGNSQKIVIK